MRHWSAFSLYAFMLLLAVIAPARRSIAQTVVSQFTAEQLVQNALVRNADLLAARQRSAEAAGLLRQAGMRPNPGIEFNVSSGALLGSSGEREFSLSFAQTFEVAGKRDRRLEVARWSAELAKFEVADRERRLAADVKTGFGRVLAAERNLQILRSLLETNERGFRLTEARVSEGEAPKLESALLRVEVNRL
jgi:cobalt-zinc-cadmium efflux system outer membrane protein